jgi:twitching motility protein PilT
VNRIDAFLELVTQQRGSDLHLVSSEPPRIRIHGALHSVRFRILSPDDLQRILEEIMSDTLRARFIDTRAVDFAYESPAVGRFRVHAYHHHKGIGAALRPVPLDVPGFDELGLPPAIKSVIGHRKGLTLVTGPTGSGKSTTLAAMVDIINSTAHGHIVTIEDPIEYVHRYKQCVISQREIGDHAPNFAEALRGAVREDPDLIMVGELRDQESISQALTAAEAGIQVLGTLHTRGATGTIDRIVNVFPEKQQELVRHMLADGLRMIVSQRLVPTADHASRVPAVELLVNTSAAATMIRTGQSHKLMTVIQSSRRTGMQSLDGSLKDLMQRKVITPESAHEHALDRTQFERYLVRTDAA